MKKIIACFLVAFCLTGCANSSTINYESSEMDTSSDYSILDESGSLSEEERAAKTWKRHCDDCLASLMGIEEVASVRFIPDSYEEYINQDKCVTVELVFKQDVENPEQEKNDVASWLENQGVFEDFEIQYTVEQ